MGQQPGAATTYSETSGSAASTSYSANANSIAGQNSWQTQALLSDASSYAALYYDQYVAYVRQEAEAALRVAEQHATRVMVQVESSGESRPASEPHSNANVVEPPAPEVQAVAQAAPISAGQSDGETLIPLHHQAVRLDWTAELVPQGGGDDAPMLSEQPAVTRIAAAGIETREDLVESGNPVSGDLPLDLTALERQILQFFEYVGSRAQEMTTFPSMRNLGAWLTAAAAATAAFEFARRSARPLKTVGFANLGWHEICLGLFPGHDES
jgi:hypothetical protein